MDEIIKDIIKRILEERNDLKSLPVEFAKGKRIAYYEILDMINNRLEILGCDPSDFGIEDDPFKLLEES